MRLLILAVLANVVDAAGASDLVGVVSGFWSVLASLCIASLSLLWIFTVTAVLRKATRRAKWMQFLWIFFVSSGHSGHLHDRFSLGFGVGVHATVPLTAAERRRAEARSGLLPTGDRVALDATRNRRKRLFLQFQTWLWKEKGVSLLFLLRQKPA